MRILRKGARADHGTKSVELKGAKLQWNPTVGAFDQTFAKAARDFSTDGRHQYKLRLTPDEQADQLVMLADTASSMDPEDFQEAFRKALGALFRLQAMASGMKLAA